MGSFAQTKNFKVTNVATGEQKDYTHYLKE
jgi:hypothetical protein